MQLYLNEHINHLTTFVGLFSLYSPLRWIIYYISIVKKVLKPRTKVEMTEKSISLYNRETEKIESIKLNEKFAIQKKIFPHWNLVFSILLQANFHFGNSYLSN